MARWNVGRRQVVSMGSPATGGHHVNATPRVLKVGEGVIGMGANAVVMKSALLGVSTNCARPW